MGGHCRPVSVSSLRDPDNFYIKLALFFSSLKTNYFRSTTKLLYSELVFLSRIHIVMTPAAHVQAAIELVEQSINTQRPADRLLSGYFRQRRYIGSKDKAAIAEQFYGVLRRRSELYYLLENSNLDKTPDNLLAVYHHLSENDISQLFSDERYAPAQLTPSVLEALQKISANDLENAPKSVALNIPEWLAESLEDSLAEHFEAEMQACNQRASTDLRVNLLKSSMDKTSQVLAEQGVEFSQTDLSPWGLRLNKNIALQTIKQFNQGWFEVQDEGSQLLALLVDAKAGNRVVDFCAGGGGKSLAMSATMQNKGSILAMDVHDRRLAQLQKRAKRAGAHNIRTRVLSSEQDSWVKRNTQTADIVLVDAPCSGTGTWRRNPDSRWNLKQRDIDELSQLQRSILNSASRLVKPGGKLFYATCSVLKIENEAQTEEFIKHHPEFKASSLNTEHFFNQDQLNKLWQPSNSQLRMLASLNGTDGFYLSAFERQNDQMTICLS